MTQRQSRHPESGKVDRERRFLKSAAFLVLAKVTGIIVNLVSIPLAYNYLGSERYGLWLAISSVIAIFAFADFGLGNGLVSRAAEADGRDDILALKQASSTAAFVIVGLSFLILLMFLAASSKIPLASLLNVRQAALEAEVRSALSILVILFSVGMPLGLVNKIQSGLQQGYRSAVWQCIGSLMSVICLLLVVRQQLGLPWLVAAVAGAPVLATLLNWLDFFLRLRRDLLPRWEHVQFASARSIAGIGVAFFALQLVVSMTSAADVLLIAKIIGPDAVAGYAIPDRLFTQVSSILLLAMSPLWPAYGEAVARGDVKWALKTLRKSVLMAAFGSFAAVGALVVMASSIIEFWIGKNLSIPNGLLLALSFWKIIESIGGTLAAFLNGVGAMRIQVACALLTGSISLGLKIWAIPIWGVAAIPAIMSISFVAFSIVPCALLIPRMRIWRNEGEAIHG